MFTKILVAVSLSPSDALLASAIETARRYDARLAALHVVDPAPGFAGAADYDLGAVLEAMQAYGQEVATRVSHSLDAYALHDGTRMVTLPISGMTVGEAIASCAATAGADLILLGKRRPGWWRWLGEDVAAQVRRHTDTPIQIVSGTPAGGQARRPGRRWAEAPAAGAR